MRDSNNKVLVTLRVQYAELQKRLETLDKELQVLDKSRCPLSDIEQSEIRQALAPHLPEGQSLDYVLMTPDERTRCLAWLDAVTNLPISPQFSRGDDDETRIAAIAASIQIAYRDMEIGFQLPDAWKKIAKALKDRLASVLETHLPQTMGGLWKELVLNLTPAPWQIPGSMKMQVESRRGRQEVRLSVNSNDKSRLARYILNEAEKNSLGLAWFLVRYLCQGRFRHAVLALDDPALDMDQATFRDLCRLMESILRLHRSRKLPLALLIFLHQDERALDAARATGGLLHRLAWNAGETELVKSIKLLSESYRHPLPSLVFQRVQAPA